MLSAPSIVDEHDCICKVYKPGLVKRLDVHETSQAVAESVIMDGHQLFYDIEMPHCDKPSYLIASMQDGLVHYTDDFEKIIAFDQ